MKEWSRDDDNGRIRFHRGFPDSNEALAIARAAATTAKTVLIIEDSNHEYDSVRSNMHAYHELVTPGSYFLIQDMRLGGPLQAIQQFLNSKNGTCFDIDKRWEYFIFSQHFDGFLRRRENCTTS
jgi:cephalosporin hydroxylase